MDEDVSDGGPCSAEESDAPPAVSDMGSNKSDDAGDSSSESLS